MSKQYIEIRDDFGGCHAMFCNDDENYHIKHVSKGPVLRGTLSNESIPPDIKYRVKAVIHFEGEYSWFFKTKESAEKVYKLLLDLSGAKSIREKS